MTSTVEKVNIDYSSGYESRSISHILARKVNNTTIGYKCVACTKKCGRSIERQSLEWKADVEYVCSRFRMDSF